MTTGWRIGHKDILEFMGRQFRVYSWRTVLRWKNPKNPKVGGMPFHRLWSGQPYIIESEVIKWQLKEKP